MIVATLSDPFLRAVLRRAASPDEDVICGEGRVLDALERGFPRLMVLGPGDPGAMVRVGERRESPPVLEVTPDLLRRWEADRRSHEVAPRKIEYLATRLRDEIRHRATHIAWIAAVFRDLAATAGSPLPPALKGLGRRVMEYPARYRTLRPLESATGLSPDSLKARFRRRELESPSVYLRWFRAVAVVHVLTREGLGYREGAFRLGFAGSSNLCRFVERTTGLSPGVLTGQHGRERLLASFVSALLEAETLERWQRMDRVFLRGVA